METTTQSKKERKVYPQSLRKQVLAEYKAGATGESLSKKYGFHVSCLYNWQNKAKKKKLIKQTLGKSKVTKPILNGKPHDSEKELLRMFFVQSLADRFKKSLEGKSAAALIEINKGMTEKGM